MIFVVVPAAVVVIYCSNEQLKLHHIFLGNPMAHRLDVCGHCDRENCHSLVMNLSKAA